MPSRATTEKFEDDAAAPLRDPAMFSRSYDEHADACEDAWRRVLGFFSALE